MQLHGKVGFPPISHEIAMTNRPSVAALPKKPLLILIAGPYLSGTQGDASRIARNLAFLESYALPIYALGHLPMVGEWLALPLIHSAGGKTHDDPIFAQYQYPVAARLLERCDALLRVPGESRGADLDVVRARDLGLPVFHQLEDIPRLSQSN